MTTDNTKPLTAADRSALDELSDSGWFDVAHAPIARPGYRCKRLEDAGLLMRRVVVVVGEDGQTTARTEFSRHPKPIADWSAAPEGTTHVMRVPGDTRVVWIKVVDRFEAFWRWPAARGWRRSTESSAMLVKRRSVEPRPLEFTEPA